MTVRPVHPFQADGKQLHDYLDDYVTATVASLASYYLVLPRHDDFLEYAPFRKAYQKLLADTDGFRTLDRLVIHQAVRENGLILVVLRAMAGLSPPELADFAQETLGIEVSQNFARAQDADARRGKNPLANPRVRQDTRDRIIGMVNAACEAIERGPENASPLIVHRLDKVDTAQGLLTVRKAASEGIEYSMLLYERMLGRPFATYRDSISSKVGDTVEDGVEEVLKAHRVPYYKAARAEAFEDLDQAPDFMIPTKEEPRVLIEAKLAQDDGTARDKITRVQHLASVSNNGQRFQVIACIDGRGFRYRASGMRKLLSETKGKVFTLKTMAYLVEETELRSFAVPRGND